jgi:hypothetical protein
MRDQALAALTQMEGDADRVAIKAGGDRAILFTASVGGTSTGVGWRRRGLGRK